MVIIGRQEYPSPFIFFELMKMVWVGEYRSSRGIGGRGGSGGLKPTLQPPTVKPTLHIYPKHPFYLFTLRSRYTSQIGSNRFPPVKPKRG